MTNPIILQTLRQLQCSSSERRLSSQVAITESATAITPHLPRHSLVILRAYQHPQRAQYAATLARLCRKKHWKLLIAGNPRLAVTVRAAGIHMPESQAWSLSAWRKKKPDWLITMAAHSPKALWRASRLKADAALYSPVFPTNSHPGMPALGTVLFNAQIRRSPIPVYALGGMTARTIPRLKGSHAIGIAAIGLWQTSV